MPYMRAARACSGHTCLVGLWMSAAVAVSCLEACITVQESVRSDTLTVEFCSLGHA